MEKLEILRNYFGYTAFREGQERLIDGLLAGRDVFGIMPTGGGKSICYQIPALMLPGVTLVVSPLISLMKDQVMALRSAGIPAAYLNSSLTVEQIRRVYSSLWDNEYKILYIAPERLMTDSFLSVAQNIRISLLAVDEAHCISQWGQDFRPSYLKILDFLNLLPRRPVVAAFTATATRQVQQDVERMLDLQDPVRIITGFDRPNLYYEVRHPKHKEEELLSLLDSRRKKSGIVYCATRKDVEMVCDTLREQGYPATRYHAGLSDEERQRNQEDFVYDRARVMVATNAFGMGIDKSNVSYVIHYAMPKSLEAYYQEAGRAGRDGEKAECFLLYAPADVRMAQFLIENSGENEELTLEEHQQRMAQDYARLEVMSTYCKTDRCLRSYILDYFGEQGSEPCGNCGSCREGGVREDITRQAQMILSCIQRIHDKLGFLVGSGAVIKTLRGSRDGKLREWGLDSLSTYGLMRNIPEAQIREYITALEAQGYLHTQMPHRTLMMRPQAAEVLFRGKKVEMRVHGKTAAVRPKPTVLEVEEDGLMTVLKELRLKLAREENVPLYVVFSNRTLVDMAEKQPVTEAEFLTVSGVGSAKAAKYAKPFLRAIRQYRKTEEGKKKTGNR